MWNLGEGLRHAPVPRKTWLSTKLYQVYVVVDLQCNHIQIWYVYLLRDTRLSFKWRFQDSSSLPPQVYLMSARILLERKEKMDVKPWRN